MYDKKKYIYIRLMSGGELGMKNFCIGGMGGFSSERERERAKK